MAHFENNARFFQQQRADTEYTDYAIMLTGYIDPATGVLASDPTTGLDPGYIWLHSEYGRANTRAIIGAVRSDLAGARVVTGINRGGERVAIRPVYDGENVSIWGANLPGLGVPVFPGQSVNTPLPSRLLMGGRVLQVNRASPGLTVFVEAYPAGGLMTDDSAHSLSADAPASTGFLWSVLFLDTDGLVYSATTALQASAGVKEALAVADAYALPMPAGAYRLAAVSLYYGQTDILYSNSRFEDLRGFIDPNDAGGQWVVNYTASIPAGLTAAIGRGVRVANNGSLTVDGALYIL